MLIGNLETSIAGRQLGYADDSFDMYSMNAPLEFAQAIKGHGIDLALTGNILRTQNRSIFNGCGLVAGLKLWVVMHVIGTRCYVMIKKKLGMIYNKPTIDNSIDQLDVNVYLGKIKNQIQTAKRNADIVFVCPHMGGQFNTTPGAFSNYVMKRLVEMGADAIIGSHPHVVQKAEVRNTSYCFFVLEM